MAPLPPDSTARLKVHYKVCTFNHTAEIRLGEGVAVADGIADFTALVTAASNLLFLSEFIGADYAASGSNVFNPVEGAWPTSWGVDAGTPADTANMLSFRGRSLDGRRGSIVLFGCQLEKFNGSFRITTGDSEAVNDAVNVLDGTEGTFVTINGFQPVWKQYANIGPNAYWRNKVR